MNQQFEHSMLPHTTHDELARQQFMQSLATYINRQLAPGNKVLYEKSAKPKFEQEHQRSPENRHEIRAAMQSEPFYRWWSAMRRTQQEMMWESVSCSVDRQLPELLQRAEQAGEKFGSLTLDPDFQLPAYQTAVDIHCMPGGYAGEFRENDVTVGAVYDRGTYLYGKGWLGPLNDDMGQSITHYYLKPQYPNFHPSKILDMGCSVGHSTLPYVEAYPNAEVYAIDVAAPMLRYGHARAEALGKRVHFCQQNAEHTHFPESAFDLIVSHILLHEIPVFAIRNVMRECYRLLAPGGMMIHVEAPLYRHLDPYNAFLYEWQTTNNNEPFWSAMRDLDLTAVATEAGFEREQVRETFVPNGVWKIPKLDDTAQTVKPSNPGTWFVLAATK